MSNKIILHYLVYSYRPLSQNDLEAFIADRKIKTTSISHAKPYKAFDIEMIAPNNIDKLRRWMSRPHCLTDGTVLHFAEVSRPYGTVKFQKADHIQLLAEGCSLYLLGQLVINDKNSFLVHAIYTGRLASARALADAGALMDPPYEYEHANELRLWTAVLHGKADELGRRIDAGDDINQAPEDGSAKNWTPLSLCANLGRHEMAEVLLDHGANVEGIEGELMTPVAVAASADDVHLMKLFVQHGAMIDVAGVGKYDIVPSAVRMGATRALDYLTEEYGLSLTAELVEQFCDSHELRYNMKKVLQHFDLQPASAEDSVQLAIKTKSLGMLRRSLDTGLDIESIYSDHFGDKTALLLCVAAGWPEGVTELLSRGARDPGAVKQRAIELAFKMNKWTVCKLLSSAGHGYKTPNGQRKTLNVKVTPADDEAQSCVESLLKERLGINVESMVCEDQFDTDSITFICECADLRPNALLNRQNIRQGAHEISMSTVGSPNQTGRRPARLARNTTGIYRSSTYK